MYGELAKEIDQLNLSFHILYYTTNICPVIISCSNITGYCIPEPKI
jgi:hypothetical protein